VNTETFDRILKERIEKIQKVLGTKAKEYALGGDRLHNFKTAAAMGQTTQEKALWGMAMKHLVSVVDLVEGRLPVSEYFVNEKIGDLINYLILLEAALLEPLRQPGEWTEGHVNETIQNSNTK
jgi:hypothetical protein